MDHIAHYRVKRRLGAGGMGEVYLATDTRLDRDVALKVLPDALTASAAARARLVREARTASALNHANICHIYEVGESDQRAYIAMELVEGRPLAQSIPADGLAIETVLRYAGQLAEALAHAHDRGVLHRDLKSSNVMVTPEGRVKVLDFGLAKRAVVDPDDATRTVDSVTQAGSVAGTLHYLAPEVLRGQAADARSDIWALGVVLFEMATGKLPFSGQTSFEVSAAILRESPQHLPPQVPAGLRAIIGRCLAKEPAQRYQRASELRAAVEAISSDSAAAPVAAASTGGVPRKDSAGSVPTLTFEQPRRSKWLVWGGAALVLLLLGGLWYLRPFSQHANDAAPSAPVASPQPAYTGPRVSTGGKASPNPEANSYFEKATLFLRGQFDVPRAHDLLEKALEADPKFAEARSMYALTHLLQVEGGLSNETAWLYRAERQLQQALRDDPDCASVQAVLGALYLFQGKRELGRQLGAEFERDPRQLPGRIWQVHYYRLSGNYPAGIAMARETLRLMPVFFISQVLLGNMLHETGDMPAAVREFGGVLDQDPQNLFALRELARGHIETGDIKTAKIFLEKIRESDRRNYRARLAWALLYAREGKRRDAQREMDAEVLKYAEVNPNVTLEAAEFYAILGDKAKALYWLERAVRNGDERTEWFQRDPLLESIRGEERFKNLLASIAYRRQQQKQ